MCKIQRLVLQNELQKELRLADDLARVKFWSKGAFINTLVGGGWAKWRGGQKSFELPEGGDQKVFRSKGGGVQKSLVKLKV